jgi:sugar lactone lactonase YvrE
MRSEVVVTGFSFTESVRWHDGKLWFADMHEGKVFTLDGGEAETAFELAGFVSGFDWLDSGELIVTSMLDRKLLRVAGGEAEVYADLLTFAEYHLNDLLIHDDHCYSVNFGFDAFVGAPPAPASIVHVAPDRTVAPAAEPLMFPNGMVITDGGATFLVAESFGDRIIAFDRAEDGSLSNPRTWATVPEGCVPDGIEIDADGNLWIPGAGDSHLRLVAAGGEVLEDVDLGPRLPHSLAFGGPDRKTLYVATCETFSPFETREKSSAAIEAIAVEVAGAAAGD